MTPVAVAPTIEPGPVKPLQKDAMTRETKMPIRLASPADARAFGKLLYAFNLEFGEETPAGELIARRAAPLIENGELTVWVPRTSFASVGPEVAHRRCSESYRRREQSSARDLLVHARARIPGHVELGKGG